MKNNKYVWVRRDQFWMVMFRNEKGDIRFPSLINKSPDTVTQEIRKMLADLDGNDPEFLQETSAYTELYKS